MPTPQWLASSQNGNAVPGGDPAGSAVTKVSGADSVYNAPARTRDHLIGVGSFVVSIDVASYAVVGLTSETDAVNIAAVNFPYAIGIGAGYATVLHNGAYVADLILPSPLTGVHAFTIEVFDSGAGVLKARYLLDGVVKHTESGAMAGLPLALGLNIATLNATLSSISGTGTSVDNAAPVVSAGADLNLLRGETANLAGSATDDGLPFGTLEYAWSKVSGPGTVTFGTASLASSTATFSAIGVYVLRLTVTDGELTGTDDLTVTITAAPPKPVAPLTYDLDVSTLPRLLPADPPVLPIAGSTGLDTRFFTPITRVTDAATAGGESFGTSSAALTNGWASDDSAFLAVGEEGTYIVYDFNPVSGVYSRGESFTAGHEPTFSRSITRPHLLYGCTSSNDLKVKVRNRLTQAWTLLWDVRDDVPALAPGGNAFLGGIYNSEDSPERVVFAYGATQDTHPYVTILDVENPATRVTLDVDTAKLKINGGAWQQLLKPDGTNSAISVGVHSTSIDRTGKWVQILYAGGDGGARKGAFFNMETKRIHEYDADKWFGHSSLGKRTHVTFASGLAVPPQWDLTALEQGGVFPTGRLLISPAPNPGDWFLQDHNNWNNCRQDGAATPFISGIQVQRSGTGGPTPANASNLANWSALWDELALISTDPAAVKGTDMWWRICHHHVRLVNGAGQYIATFRDSPRVQIAHGGLWTVFQSNWGLTLGTRGTAKRNATTGLDDPNGTININHRRDLFLVRNSRSAIGSPPLPTVEVGVDEEVDTVDSLLTRTDTTRVLFADEVSRFLVHQVRIEKGVTMADITIYRGARKQVRCTLAPVDNITGWTIEAKLRAIDATSKKPTGPVLKTVTAELTTPLSGIFTIPFSDTDSDLPPGVYAWDVWRTNPGNKEIVMPPCTVTILGSVTNP